MIQLITTASDRSKCAMLEKSLKKHNWPYHIIEHEWQGFGCKILETYRYLKANPHITHFFYSDSYDTVVLGTMEEAISKILNKDIILQSAERACYPHSEKEALYPKHDSPWHFVNGGGWFASVELWCKMIECKPLTVNDVDQVYFTDRFLEGVHGMRLDYNCDVFQTIAFCPQSDFLTVGERILNTVTGSKPLFFHGNGHTPMTEIYKPI